MGRLWTISWNLCESLLQTKSEENSSIRVSFVLHFHYIRAVAFRILLWHENKAGTPDTLCE